jgi:hypothetical protein
LTSWKAISFSKGSLPYSQFPRTAGTLPFSETFIKDSIYFILNIFKHDGCIFNALFVCMRCSAYFCWHFSSSLCSATTDNERRLAVSTVARNWMQGDYLCLCHAYGWNLTFALFGRTLCTQPVVRRPHRALATNTCGIQEFCNYQHWHFIARLICVVADTGRMFRRTLEPRLKHLVRYEQHFWKQILGAREI